MAAAARALPELGYTVMEHRPAALLDEVRVRQPRGLDRPEARHHHLGGRDLLHQLDVTALDGLTVRAASCVLLVVIGVGIMNTLWIAIRERTREIGTLRAIGMQRRRVLLMFLIEALMLGAAAAR